MQKFSLTKPIFLLATVCAAALPMLAESVFAAPNLPAETLRQAGKSPLKVFILAGQSNMQGQGTLEAKDDAGNEKKGTLRSLLADPAKAPLIKHLVNAKGEWAEVRDDVWVYDIGEFGTIHGPLSFGYGWNLGDMSWQGRNKMFFGPEVAFGHLMGDHFAEQVLIIKTAWGGKSLDVDFRPPSSGGAVGPFYTEMLATVSKVLGDIKAQFPGYKGDGYELSGFVWWHGWNDFCDAKATAAYEKNLINLIKDVRADLKAPQLPVIIGEFAGPWLKDIPPEALTIRKAQADVAAKPEFKETVKFVKTTGFLRAEKDSPSGAGHHEYQNGETYFLIGDAFGKAMIPLLVPAKPTLTLLTPADYQVVQRGSLTKGKLAITGRFDPVTAKTSTLGARIVVGDKPGVWQKLVPTFHGAEFEVTLDVPAGGWYRLELRGVATDKSVMDATVEHVGVGEVFVVAGQSNSANHGEEKQSTKSGKVATFDGKHWQLSNDPQPGASGDGGSFMPPFGDAMAVQLNVPIGLVACGIGATSVREWLAEGSQFPNPPTIETHVTKLASGGWQSKGVIYPAFVARMKQLGPNGFRAVLWHQGESDANQSDATRTLPGKLYRQYLEKLILDTRHDIGWNAPWFVAQVSYHGPGDEASPEIRAAQASLWKAGIALEGPDSDAIKGELRENGGKGVHFSGAGLRELAARWVAKIAPRLGALKN